MPFHQGRDLEAGSDAGFEQVAFRFDRGSAPAHHRLAGLPAVLFQEAGDAADGVGDAARQVDRESSSKSTA